MRIGAARGHGRRSRCSCAPTWSAAIANDPSILVEKRFGIGYTINFGNPKAVVALGLIAAAA